MTDNGIDNEDNGTFNQNNSFQPLLYNFRVPPLNNNGSKFAVQLPFSVLFDNLITVIWAVYGKDTKITISINQVQWALEFLKCMKVDYSYPESIRIVVHVLEKYLLQLYAIVGEKLYMIKNKQELDGSNMEDDTSQNLEEEKVKIICQSLNETDIMNKLNTIILPIDSKTGNNKNLNELNSLGRRKPVVDDKKCDTDSKSSKTYMIGALQKILNKTTEVETKSEVEELIKGLKVKNTVPESTKPAEAS